MTYFLVFREKSYHVFDMKIFYESENAVLYRGDCIGARRFLDRNSVDLLIADPPYGMKWRSGRGKKKFPAMLNDDGTLDVSKYFLKLLPILRNGRHLYIFGPADLSDLPITKTAELIWAKKIISLGDLTIPWGPEHEKILFGTYCWSKANRDKGYGKLTARLRQGSVLEVQRLNGKQVFKHTSEKPVDLIRQLVESSSVVGETVFDPFAGSGSTLVAALLEGRKAVGIELDLDYCKVIRRRLRKVEKYMEGFKNIMY